MKTRINLFKGAFLALPLLACLCLPLLLFSSSWGGGKLEASAPPAVPDSGAHQVHVSQSLFSKTYECIDCHPKDGSSMVKFGALAQRDGANPVWDPVSRTCSNVYCHGATSSGGTRTVVRWISPMESDLIVCGACHANPPTVNHVKSANCGLCHRGISTGAGINKDLHVNGEVEVIQWNPTDAKAICQDCHGIPPKDNHLSAAECSLCHPALKGGKDPAWKTHMNGKVDVIKWDASTPGIKCNACHAIPPSREGHLSAGQCSLCHPAEKGKKFSMAKHMNGKIDAIAWSDDIDLGCDECHGFPPEMDHPEDDECHNCHGSVINEDGEIIRAHLHMNGHIDD